MKFVIANLFAKYIILLTLKNQRIYQNRKTTFCSIESDMNHELKLLFYVKPLTIMASRKDDKKDDSRKEEGTNITSNPQQQATDSINRAIEETRDSIKRSTDETRREIPRYRDSMTEFQRQTVDTTREMAEIGRASCRE